MSFQWDQLHSVKDNHKKSAANGLGKFQESKQEVIPAFIPTRILPIINTATELDTLVTPKNMPPDITSALFITSVIFLK